jgi:pyruvate carboxylase
LLAKVIVQAPDFAGAVARSARALSEFRLEGVATNIAFLGNILAHSDFAAGNVHTRWVDEHIEVAALFWTKNRAALGGELLQRNGDNANAKE